MRAVANPAAEGTAWSLVAHAALPVCEALPHYIAVERPKPFEACATIWPIIEPDQVSMPRGAGWKRPIIGALVSFVLHCGVAAAALAMMPMLEEVSAGSEAVSVDVMDEAAFAALTEGISSGSDEPQLTLPEPITPAAIEQSVADAREAVAVTAPEPDVNKVQPVAQAELALPEPPKTEPVAVEQKKVVPPNRRKPMSLKGDNTANRAPGKQGNGADAVSTARLVPGSGARQTGINGKATNPNLRAQIIAHLGRYKRYPPAAEVMRLEGSVGITFSVGLDGKLTSASVHASSGYGPLDNEALAMLRRAQPFPVSDGTGGRVITITTQIGYVYPR